MLRDNPVTRENSLPGSSDWQLTRVMLGPEAIRSSFIEGYCSHQSVAAGDELQIMVSTNPASRFEVEIFRMGYYNGAGARLMTKLGPFQGHSQPEPPIENHRLRKCRWEASVAFTIPDDWLSGVYLGRLTTLPENEQQPYWQSYVIFIVRDHRRAEVIFQCSDNTWQAYNSWPGGWSLYTDPRGSHVVDVSVSFNRPYGKYPQIFDVPQSVGSGEFLLWEFPLAFWLEQQGYDVTYCSNADVLESTQLTRCPVFLSVGHDEYWDLRQYEAVRQAIEQGVAVLWLGANDVHVVSPLTASSTGQPHRTLTRKGIYGGFTQAELETYGHCYVGITQRGPDESLLIGARTHLPVNGGGDWVCTRPEHWIYEGTGMRQGDKIPGLIGWEYHGAPAAIPGLEVVAQGTAWQSGRNPASWSATLFEGPRGNLVFNAATIFWSQALASPPGHTLPWSHGSRPHGVDERVQRMTQNVLERALKGGERKPS